MAGTSHQHQLRKRSLGRRSYSQVLGRAVLAEAFTDCRNWKENLGNRIGCVVCSATSQLSVTLDNLIRRFGLSTRQK